jgi:hypothetical protein
MDTSLAVLSPWWRARRSRTRASPSMRSTGVTSGVATGAAASEAGSVEVRGAACRATRTGASSRAALGASP